MQLTHDYFLSIKKNLMDNPAFEITLDEIARTAAYLWDKGWAERNAGNISVNISGLMSSKEVDLFNNPVPPLPIAYPHLANQYLIVTTAGSRMRDLARHPWEHSFILKMNADGTSYQASCSASVPTSELPTHLAVHNMLLRTKSTAKALLHAHATELIALTQISELCSTEKLNRLLWGMHPETMLFISKGLGFIPYEISQNQDIAKTTAKTLEKYPVALWEKHGVLSTGTSISDAFDNIDLLVKAAKIYFMVKSTGKEPEGLTDNQITELRKNL